MQLPLREQNSFGYDVGPRPPAAPVTAPQAQALRAVGDLSLKATYIIAQGNALG